MTIENWLTIALIISTLIGPVIATLFPLRAQDHPTPTPEANQPKKRIQRTWEWWVRFSNSPWLFPPFLIALNTYLLLSELRLTTPVTRWAVVRISADMAAIWYGVVLFFLNILWQQIKRQWEINGLLSEMDREILEIVSNVNRAQSGILGLVTNLANDRPKPEPSADTQLPQGESSNPKPKRSGRLLAAIKVLMGD